MSLSKRQMAALTSEDGAGFDSAINGNGSSNSEILIPLPHSESIPQQFWTLACGWIPIVGRDIVACLFSRDWQASTNRIHAYRTPLLNSSSPQSKTNTTQVKNDFSLG